MSETQAQAGQIRTEANGHVLKIIIDNAAKKNSFILTTPRSLCRS
jgi:enoyl-CoA hydratase